MRFFAAAAGLALVASAAPAAASHPSPQLIIGDPAGDANFINDGGEFGSGNQPTPTSEPSLDLRRVELAPLTRAGSRVGFTVMMTTQGLLKDRVQLTLKTRTQNCADILLVYVHGSGGPAAGLSSGCSSKVILLKAQVDLRRVTIIVPFTALPEKARRDKLLQTVNAFSQMHLAREPLFQRPRGTNSPDTTLQRATYRLR